MLGKKSWFAVPNGLQKGEDMEVVVNIDELKENLKVKDDVNVAYVIECAESVGIPITDETPLDFKLMAEIMRTLRERIEMYERH